VVVPDSARPERRAVPVSDRRQADRYSSLSIAWEGADAMADTRSDSQPNVHAPIPGRVVAVALNYQHPGDTLRCVQSLGSSDYDNLQILVVDNGSDDAVVSQLRQELDPTVTLIESTENLGYGGGGNNIGLAKAVDAGAEFVWVGTEVELGLLEVEEPPVRSKVERHDPGWVSIYDRLVTEATRDGIQGRRGYRDLAEFEFAGAG